MVLAAALEENSTLKLASTHDFAVHLLVCCVCVCVFVLQMAPVNLQQKTRCSKYACRNGLVLVHNTIHQAGLKAIQTSISKNTSMVKCLDRCQPVA